MIPQTSSDLHCLPSIRLVYKNTNLNKISTRCYLGIKSILKSSWHTHLKHFKPNTFIIQTVKNPPDRFCTYILFASKIILIYSGIFLYRLSSLLRVNIKWLKVTTFYFSKKNAEIGDITQNQVKPYVIQ